MPKKKGLIYVKKLLNDREKHIFKVWYNMLMKHFVEGQVPPATEMLIQVACIDFIRVLRSLEYERDNPNWKPRYAAELTNNLRRTLKALGITPEQNMESDLGKSLSEIFLKLDNKEEKKDEQS